MTYIRHIRSFVVLAEELHFGHAAARLNIVQPALSMHIKTLEEELGASLFHRSSRSVSLTHAGEVFRADAIAILQRVEDAVDRVHRAREGRIGELKLAGSATALASGVTAPFIRSYASRFPDVSLKVREIHPFAQAEALQDEDIDIAFASQQIEEKFPGRFASKKLAAYPYVLAVSHDHPLARKKHVPIDCIAGQTLICLENERDHAGINPVFGTLPGEPDHYLFASSPLTMLSLVDADLGVAVVSSALQKNARQGITFIPLDDLTQQMEVWMYTRQSDTEPVVCGFLAIVEELSGRAKTAGGNLTL